MSRSAHLSDDEAVAKMGHPDLWLRDGDEDAALDVVEIGEVAGVRPVAGVED
jgi:hypothetical protein